MSMCFGFGVIYIYIYNIGGFDEID